MKDKIARKEIEDLRQRIKVLECPHKNTKHTVAFGPFSWSPRKQCIDCGKVLVSFDTEVDYLESKLKDAQQNCSDNIEQIKTRLKKAKEEEEEEEEEEE